MSNNEGQVQLKKPKKYTITKSTVECYKLRHESGMYWADITIDAKDQTGRIQIASDYGSWQYYWGACGIRFKEFLLTLGIDYAACKFGEDQWFDSDATVKSWKADVVQYRREEVLTAEQARQILDEIVYLEKHCSDESDFNIQVSGDSPRLMKFYNHCPNYVRSISPRFKNFWKHCWAAFCAELKTELIPSNQAIDSTNQ